ncbi:MAG TPA: amidohydrolase family protein, partial [Luteimonas sp.]
MLRAVLLATLALPTPGFAQAAPPATQVLHCGGLFDARAGRVLGPHTIVVREGRIAEVLAGRTEPVGGTAIDLSSRTCSPGWTDLHVHLDGESSPQSYSEGFRLDPVDFAFRSVGYARKT